MPHPEVLGPGDIPALQWLGKCQLATAYQWLDFLWTRTGRHVSAGYAQLRRLEAGGWVNVGRRRHSRPGPSMRVLALTRKAHRLLGRPIPSPMPLERPNDLQLARLQRVETHLVLHADGWREVSGQTAFDALKRRTLAHRPAGLMFDQAAREKRELAKLARGALGRTAYVHPAHGVRWVLEVREGRSVQGQLGALPAEQLRRLAHLADGRLDLQERLGIQLVGWDRAWIRLAGQAVRRWEKREKVVVQIHEVRPFWARPRPGASHAANPRDDFADFSDGL